VNISQNLVEVYLARAIEEFDANRLSTRLIRRLSDEFPGLFLPAALPYLLSNQQSNALRFLAATALRQEAMFEYLTSPKGSRENAINLFKRFLEIDPSFDVKLAERLPNRRETNISEALDGPHATRALDILDQTSRGRRLLPIVGHLPTYRDIRISAKATLFVGRRVLNPSWTRRQLDQRDQRVRANAVESLWGLNSPAAMHVLEDCAEDVNNRVSGNSLLGLHILGRSEVERRVLELAADGKHEFRSTAAWIMGRMGSKECFDRLTALVRDDHPQVRSTALRSLIELRRAANRTPEAIAARAAEMPPEAEAKTLQSVAQVINPGLSDKEFALRFDGTAFKVT
jgi:hypothetical protein